MQTNNRVNHQPCDFIQNVTGANWLYNSQLKPGYTWQECKDGCLDAPSYISNGQTSHMGICAIQGEVKRV